jgi:hypothetical protein
MNGQFGQPGTVQQKRSFRLLHQETWKTTQGTEREDLTLSPAGKFVPWTVRQIYENLD